MTHSRMNTHTRTLIMAVPFDQDRVRNVKYLQELTGAEIVWDEKRSIMDTWIRVLETAGDDAVIILQDDIELVEGWREKVEAVIKEHGDSVCQFFSIRQSDLTEGSRYVSGSRYLMNQCYYLPATYAGQVAEFARAWWSDYPDETGDDTCLSQWLSYRREKYWHNVPSLVQHRSVRSVVDGRRSSARQSPTFGMEA